MNSSRLSLVLTVLAATAALTLSSTVTATDRAEASPPRPAGTDELGWRLLQTPASPPARDQSSVAYHVGTQRTVLFSGHDYGVPQDDTWVFDGETWTELELGARPPARYQAPMAYDPVRDELVLYGGLASRTELGDTWVFDGARWKERRPAVSPPALAGASMAFDLERGEMVLFGGDLDSGEPSAETWVWDGSNWEQRLPATSPAAQANRAMAWSGWHHGIVLVGSNERGRKVRSLLWDGTTWRPVGSRPGKDVRFSPGMTSFGKRVVLYGGDFTDDDAARTTWVLGRKHWHRSGAGTDAGEMIGAAVVHHETIDAVVLVGGWRPDVHLDDTWLLSPPA